MYKKNFEKWNKIISKGKLNYVIKQGILGWGFPVGLCITISNYFIEKPEVLSNFIIESLPILIIFPIAGIFFGFFMFNHINNKINKK